MEFNDRQRGSRSLIDQLEDVRMSSHERARARAAMVKAEVFADLAARIEHAVCAAASSVATGVASLRRRLIAALTQPAHR